MNDYFDIIVGGCIALFLFVVAATVSHSWSEYTKRLDICIGKGLIWYNHDCIHKEALPHAAMLQR